MARGVQQVRGSCCRVRCAWAARRLDAGLQAAWVDGHLPRCGALPLLLGLHRSVTLRLLQLRVPAVG